MNALLVGGDSRIAGELAAALHAKGHHVTRTTRRAGIHADGWLHLDLLHAERFVAPPGTDTVYLLAGVTSYARCEVDAEAQFVNAVAVPRLAGTLLERGCRVVFVSTSSVFDGEHALPAEEEPHVPTVAYARQKSAAERAMDETRWNLCIVRLTKVLAPQVSPIDGWLRSLRQGETIHPFADLMVAPLSLDFVGAALARIGEMPVSGPLHLSGAEQLSYADLAQRLAAALGVEPSCVEPITSGESNARVFFRPRYAALGMARTKRLTGLAAQPVADVVRYLTSP